MNTFEDTQATQTTESLPIKTLGSGPSLWQWLVDAITPRRPMIADVRAEQLYQAQLDLLDAEKSVEDCGHDLAQAASRVRILTDRIDRLRGFGATEVMVETWKRYAK